VHPSRILGIDPGLNRTGYGVVDVAGGQLRFVAAGVIAVPAGALAVRLGHILVALREVIAAHGPQLAVVEKVFVNVNPQSTLLLGQARGAALCAAIDGGLVVHEYTATQVKQAVVGYGKADKRQVQAMVQRLLALSRAPATDAADALAAAICHAHAAPLAGRLGTGAAATDATAATRLAPLLRSRGTRAGRSRAAWRALVPE
jgi:crossover junction endodeoxyribonuclease RuvC